MFVISNDILIGYDYTKKLFHVKQFEIRETNQLFGWTIIHLK